VVVRGYTWWLVLILFVPLIILTLGLIGGWRLLRPRPTTPPAPTDSIASKGSLSAVPDPADHELPGTGRGVGLKPGMSFTQSRMATFLLFLFGGTFIGGGLILTSWLLFTISATVVGCLLLLVAGHNLLIQLGVGQTTVELAEHPVRPGEPVQVCLRQEGPLRLRELQLSLVCEEAATYQQGTDTRTETKCVHRSLLLVRKDVTIEREAPFEGQAELILPPGVMHSFKAKNNGINWKLVVNGTPARLPRYEREFPFVVVPPAVAPSATERRTADE
jgi:hypothetical protein